MPPDLPLKQRPQLALYKTTYIILVACLAPSHKTLVWTGTSYIVLQRGIFIVPEVHFAASRATHEHEAHEPYKQCQRIRQLHYNKHNSNPEQYNHLKKSREQVSFFSVFVLHFARIYLHTDRSAFMTGT